ncbi:MAG: tyrosine-type recombinase/integrase [Thermoproteota archaeon]
MTLQAQVERDFISDQQLIQGFVEDCKLRNFTYKTITNYQSNLGIISQFLSKSGLSLVDLDKHVLKKVLTYLRDGRGLALKTIKNYFSALSSFYQYLLWEGMADRNLVLPFRKRYLRDYKHNSNSGSKRKLISIEEMTKLINSILDPRDKAIITLLAKTGIRRGELIDIDSDDIDWTEQSIKLKPKPKRSNRLIFFDHECARILKRWLKARGNYNVESGCRALFVGEHGGRLKRHGVYYAVTRHAEKIGLHNSDSDRMEDHFTPHCCRHWFTTHLRRNGIRRELLKELRGDSRGEAVDIYDHIDRKELKRAYLATMPTLGI